jgi:hypothetical protein
MIAPAMDGGCLEGLVAVARPIVAGLVLPDAAVIVPFLAVVIEAADALGAARFIEPAARQIARLASMPAFSVGMRGTTVSASRRARSASGDGLRLEPEAAVIAVVGQDGGVP